MTSRTKGVDLASPERIIDDARNGRMFILVDDDDPAVTGDLVVAAQMATPDAVNFMATHARGLICLALTRARATQLDLPMMPQQRGSRRDAAFAVSIEAREGVTSGISAFDRARTIAVAIDAGLGADAIVSPGHVFPLIARDGGILVRAGSTEAAIDVARLAGLNPSALLCEMVNHDGRVACLPDLVDFARQHAISIGTIRDLIAFRRRHDRLVECIADQHFVSDFGGEWRYLTYRNKVDGSESYALLKGTIDPRAATLVRVHIASVFLDLLGAPGSRKFALQRAMVQIAKVGAGVIVLLPFVEHDRPLEGQTEETELRSLGIGAQILADLGIHDMRVVSGSGHRSYVGLEGYGLRVIEEIPLDP